LFVGETEFELVGAGFNGIPARETRADVDVSRLSKVCWIEDLVCRGVRQDGFGVNTSLEPISRGIKGRMYFVGEGAVAGDVIVERN
jgi:hypothetical protein